MTYKEILHNKEVRAYLEKGNEILGTMGYTDHGVAHCALVAERAAHILRQFGEKDDVVELARIAGFMHDIGNAVNRKHHAEYGALLADRILCGEKMSMSDRVEVVSCIGCHDEKEGGAFDRISAALIIADKTDVRRSRVRNVDKLDSRIHDRVNWAVKKARLKVDTDKKQIVLKLTIDEDICSMCDYFEIFLKRMLMCRKASEFFESKFKLVANGSKVL